ncbi:hypothetical protein GPALN_002313 [Globodera pallida]|nr:hypothetical protein GPALN_002313 [Globodera pallida]
MFANCRRPLVLICALIASIPLMNCLPANQTSTPIKWEKKELFELLTEMDGLEECKDKQFYCFCDYFKIEGRTTGLCCHDDRECQCCETDPLIPKEPPIVMEGADSSETCGQKCSFQCVWSKGMAAIESCCSENYQITCDEHVPRRARMFRDKAVRERNECRHNMSNIHVATERSNFNDFISECPWDTYWVPRVERPKKPKKNAAIAALSATAAIVLALFVKSVLQQQQQQQQQLM